MKKTITTLGAIASLGALASLLLVAAPAGASVRASGPDVTQAGGAVHAGVSPDNTYLSGWLCPFDEGGHDQCAYGDNGSGQTVTLYNTQDEWSEACVFGSDDCNVSNHDSWPFLKGSGFNYDYNGDPVVALKEIGGGSGVGQCIWANYSNFQTYMSGCSQYVLANLFVRVGSGAPYRYISVGQTNSENDGDVYDLNGICQISGCKLWTSTNDDPGYYQDWNWFRS
jgi:hypothetical protein